MPSSDEKSTPLEQRLREWLDEEGYPLEFSTAHVFRAAGFSVRQGSYVRGNESEAPREVDVTASVDSSKSETLIRVYHLVECKWSQDKPWIVFTSNRGMGPAACVTQTISTLLGSAMLWKDAGLEALHELDLFSTPARSGFNGRQAFSKGTDHFYNSLRSVTTLTTQLIDYYEDHGRPEGAMPRNAVIAFPLIVVDGQLFEAFYERDKDDVVLNETDHMRCHWKGAPAWRMHATVDIVTSASLPAFAAKRRSDIERLLPIMEDALTEVTTCFATGSLDRLTVTKGARGVLGLHRLFREIKNAQKRIESAADEEGS